MESVKEIRELVNLQDWKDAYYVVRQLRTDLEEETYLSSIEEMTNQGYKLFGMYDQDRVIAIAGVNQLKNLVYDKYIWVQDLVTDSGHRSKGYGHELLSYIHNWAREREYKVIALSSGVQRSEAHRFYQVQMGYKLTSYVFMNKL